MSRTHETPKRTNLLTVLCFNNRHVRLEDGAQVAPHVGNVVNNLKKTDKRR